MTGQEVTKQKILELLERVPTGNVQRNQEIIAMALIYIIKNKEKVSFT
jgi:hypothetical protein